MRILHVNKRYPPHVGGIEKHLQDLARAQSRRGGLEVEVVCVAEGTTPGYERDGRVAVLRVPQRGLAASNPLAEGILARLFASAHASAHDVWHFHYPFPTGEASLLTGKALLQPWVSSLGPRVTGARAPLSPALPPPIVCTYHSDFVAEAGLKRVLASPYARLTRSFLRHVDAVLVSSPQLAEHSRFLREVPEKVHVVPFGIDSAPLRLTEARSAEAMILKQRYGVPLLLFVGRLVPYKGVEVLLRALPLVPHAKAVLVGEGPLRQELESLASGLGVRERVFFVGSLGADALAAHYHAADVLVLPSVTPNEAFGLVQLEAHACGVPVVSTALPTGVPFANKHGETGLVVPPGDSQALAEALSQLASDQELCLRLGAQAKGRQGREFSLEVMVDRVLQVYARLLEGRVPARVSAAAVRPDCFGL